MPFATLMTFVRAAGLCDVAIGPLLQAVGWDAETMRPSHDLIAVDSLERLMRICTAKAALRTPARHFPFVFGENFGFDVVHDLDTFLSTCPTPRHGARSLDWLSLFIHPSLTVRLDEAPDVSRFIFLEGADPQVDTHRYLVEATLASMFRFSRMMFGGEPPLRALHFAHEAPTYANLYEDVFKVPVSFSQTQTAALFDTAALDQALPGSLHAMYRLAEQGVLDRLSKLPRDGRLTAELEQAFNECPHLLHLSIDTMAERLCMARRTLQRRLAEESITYREVQEQVRKRLAEQWLAEGRLSMDDIAERLGFADRRGFTQAFGRWHGMTPSEYRRGANP